MRSKQDMERARTYPPHIVHRTIVVDMVDERKATEPDPRTYEVAAGIALPVDLRGGGGGGAGTEAMNKALTFQEALSTIHGAADVGEFRPLPKEVADKFRARSPRDWVWVRRGTFGEGSCFFHSLAAALNYRGIDERTGDLLPFDPKASDGYMFERTPWKQQQMGQDFRRWFKDRISPELWARVRAEAPEHIVKGYDVLMRDFDRVEVWAENTMIKLASRVLRKNIMFLDSTQRKFFCGMHERPKDVEGTIVVLWLDRSHFEPIMAVTRMDEHHMDVLPMFTKKHSRDVMDDIYDAYSDQCKITF